MTTSIYLFDPEQKIETDFGLYGNSFLDDLLPSIFSTAILLSLGIDKRSYAVAEQANQD